MISADAGKVRGARRWGKPGAKHSAVADDAGFIMEPLKHKEELRPFAGVPVEPCEIKPNELELALTIIDQRVNEQFEPERFEDEVRSRMMERIQQKVDAQEISTPSEEAAESKIVDLLEALQASVQTSTERRPGTGDKGEGPKRRGVRASVLRNSGPERGVRAKRTEPRGCARYMERRVDKRLQTTT